jgi:hypothetical protein
MRILLVTTLLLVPALAAADRPAPSAPSAKAPPAAAAPRATDVSQMRNDDCARARKANKPCVLNIDDGSEIEGNAPTAGGSAIGVVSFTKPTSLIRIRRDFITEILKSAEDLD